MALSDEERLIEAVARAVWNGRPDETPPQMRAIAGAYINNFRNQGITLIPPPAPEPTYTIRVSEQKKDQLAIGLHERWHNDYRWESGGIKELFEFLCDMQPDPEPGS